MLIHQQVTLMLTRLYQKINEAIPTRSPTGLLDLLMELRPIIFRHFFACPYDSDTSPRVPGPSRPVDILRTSRLIHSEAFDVLYLENHFSLWAWERQEPLSLTQFPRVIDTIQNTDVEIDLCGPHPILQDPPIKKFLRLMNYFGNPSIPNGTLTITFYLGTDHIRRMRWYV